MGLEQKNMTGILLIVLSNFYLKKGQTIAKQVSIEHSYDCLASLINQYFG